MKQTTRAIAPGKLILSGEHAVVYGIPALATAVSRHASVEVRAEDGTSVHFTTPFGQVTFTEEDLLRCLQETRARYLEFLSGRRPIGEVVPTPLNFIVLAWPLVTAARPGLHIAVNSTIPLGSGMGSSAAVSAALLQALSGFAGIPMGSDDCARLSLEMEQFQHGHPSGVDSFIAVHGGMIRFEKGSDPVPVDLPPLRLQLVHTGTPTSTTGECVAQVRGRFAESEIWNDFAEACARVERAVRHDERADLIDAVRQNHRLLVEIGVVPAPVAEWIALVEQAGGAAKICGAGSVQGSAGGMVWVVGDVPPDSRYTEWMVEGESHGVRIVQ